MAAVHEEGNLPARLAELARKAAAGSESAFDELYRLTRDRAYFVAFSITKNEDDALDILQDSYLKAWSKLGTLQNHAVFGAWLNQIVGNTAKNYVKKYRPQLFQPAGGDNDPLEWQSEKDSSYVPDAAMDTDETRRLIMKIIDDLPEDQRLCVLMHYYNDLDLHEIAAALELPYETVRSRLRYAKRKISDGVEGLEKKGTKLYGAAPIPLVVWLLKYMLAESSSKLPPLILGGGTATSGGAATAVTAVMLPKIIAGVAALFIVTGGVLAATRIPSKPQEDSAAAAVTAPEGEHAALPAAAGETFGFSFPTLPAFNGRGEPSTRPDAFSAPVSPGTAATTRAAIPPVTTVVSVTIKTTAATAAKPTTATTAAKPSSSAPATTTTTTTTKTSTTTTTTTIASSRRITVMFHDYAHTSGDPYAYNSFYYGGDSRDLTRYNNNPATLTAPALRAVNGWTPVGWSASRSAATPPVIAATPGQTITAMDDADYYGVYRRDVAIAFNADGGTPATDLNTTFWYTSNPGIRNNIYSPDITMPPEPTKAGISFRHWLGDKGDICEAGASVKPRSAVYTAQWG